MHLTKFTDNSLRVLMYLAAHPDRKINISELAEECDVPRNHLTKVIHTMALKGLVETTRGKGGGVAMAHPVEKLSVGEVVRAMEGTAEVVKCDDPRCPLGPQCELRRALRKGQIAFLETLDKTTIADVMRTPTATE